MNLISLMRRFTIRLRMIGAIGVVLAMLLLVGGTGVYGLLRVDGVSQSFIDGAHADTTTVAHLRTALDEVRRAEKDMIINYEKPEEVTKFQQQWLASIEASRKAAHTLARERHDEVAALTKELVALVDAYAKLADPVVRQLMASGYDSATVANKMLRNAQEQVREAESRLAKLETHLEAQTAEGSQQRRAAVTMTIALFATAVALAMLIVVPLTLANMVSICRPLTSAQDLARAIAKGDLTGEVQVQGRDETAELQRALGEMRNALRHIVAQVRHSTDSIGVASTEIASGNADLSARTEQAASSLQQTASSMAQLTGTVTQTADSARTANQLASSASSAAARGGEVVTQVVTTMDDISSSSKKIADIIGVIDGIAFQTNILALNAAVEAARAGEQGRGFAVVAGEVRSLAQRSAEAAKEIKALIGTSVDKVEVGAKLVQDAGTTMNEIVASVQRVSDIIGEISAASSEQSSGIGQVNTAVTQLDQMTQQNAALVEQSAAAGESLREQAQKLAGVVSTFRLDAASTPAATPPQTLARSAIERAQHSAVAPRPKPAVAALKSPAPKASMPKVTPKPAAPAPAAAPAGDDWETF
jgi:methyl-accepting chemotaxis protein